MTRAEKISCGWGRGLHRSRQRAEGIEEPRQGPRRNAITSRETRSTRRVSALPEPWRHAQVRARVSPARAWAIPKLVRGAQTHAEPCVCAKTAEERSHSKMTRRRRTRVHARTACAACARVLAPQKTRVHPETHSQAKVEAYRIHRRGRTARARGPTTPCSRGGHARASAARDAIWRVCSA